MRSHPSFCWFRLSPSPPHTCGGGGRGEEVQYDHFPALLSGNEARFLVGIFRLIILILILHRFDYDEERVLKHYLWKTNAKRWMTGKK